MTTSFDEAEFLDALRTYWIYQLYTAQSGASKVNVYLMDSLDLDDIDWTIMKDCWAAVCFKDGSWEYVGMNRCEVEYELEIMCCAKIIGDKTYGEAITGKESQSATYPGVTDITKALDATLDIDNIIYNSSNSISLTNSELYESNTLGADASETYKPDDDGKNRIQIKKLNAKFKLRVIQ